MPLAGTLSTMPLPDLLQWLAAARKTGTLQVERNKVAKWLRLAEGRLVACSSDDPPQRLGQYLLSREMITEQQLREALEIHETTNYHLGQTLVDLEMISPDDLTQLLESKAEETLYSLFDWSDGVFRFDETSEELDQSLPLDLNVEDVLLRGLKRHDDMNRIRTVFPDRTLVLRYTSKPPSPEIFSDKASRTMYAAIDGERTIEEILLHVHGSEYVVQKFLFELHRDGFVEISHAKAISGTRMVAEPVAAFEQVRREVPVPAALGTTAPDTPALPREPVSASADPPAPPDLEPLEDFDFALRCSDAELGEVDAPAQQQPMAGPDPQNAPDAGDPLEHALGLARQSMEQGDLEGSLDILDALYREHPDDEALRQLLVETETMFLQQTYADAVPPSKVPVLTRPVESLASESLSPQEFFMLSRIDGTWDVKSIIQIAPLREVEALRTVKRMHTMGMIELREPE